MKEVERPVGRPSTINQMAVDTVCASVADGNSLRRACEEAGIAGSTFRDWKEHDEAISAQYARACADRAQYWAEEFMEIADNGSNDWMASNDPANPGYVQNGEALRRSQLRLDARKWMMSRILPKQFGDKITQEHTGEVGIKSILVPDRINTQPSDVNIKPEF